MDAVGFQNRAGREQLERGLERRAGAEMELAIFHAAAVVSSWIGNPGNFDK